MISTMLSAALLGGVTMMTCPSEKACDTTAVKVTNVALTEKVDDCATACETAKPCDTAAVAVTNVAMTTETKDDCATACDGAKSACDTGAAITNVALTADEAECATACPSTKAANVLAASMPGMSYRVAGNDTNCSYSAQAMASEHNKPMHYVVSNVAYETEGEAKVAHEAAMMTYADSLTRVVYNVNGKTMNCAESASKACESACSSEVKYQVGPVIFENAEDAVRAAAMAYSAMQSVAMTYAVGDETTQCSTDAANKASSCTSPMQYVINGESTTCKKSAGYMLTRERVAAAMNAVQQAAS